jgi:hypothetical protein
MTLPSFYPKKQERHCLLVVFFFPSFAPSFATFAVKTFYRKGRKEKPYPGNKKARLRGPCVRLM